MPDIWGRNEPDAYSHIAQMRQDGTWDAHQQALSLQRENAPPHNFDALGRGPGAHLQNRAESAQAIGFITDNLLAIQAMVDEILYTAHRLPDYISLNSAIPEGATSYSVRVTDYTGKGAFITNDGSDAPNATASQRLVPQALHYGGIDANWTVESLRNSMYGGFPLDTESIQAATMGALNHMEEVGLIGDTTIDATGLTNLPTAGVTAVNLQTQAANQTFDDLEASAIRNLINDDISWVIEVSDETLGGGWMGPGIDSDMCIYLPVDQYNKLFTRFIGDDENRSVARAIMEDNAWTHRTGNPIMFKSVQELAGAGVGAGVDRMLITSKSPRIFEMGVPIVPRVLRILDKGRSICAQVEYKFSPLFVKRPTVMRYRDAI